MDLTTRTKGTILFVEIRDTSMTEQVLALSDEQSCEGLTRCAYKVQQARELELPKPVREQRNKGKLLCGVT